MCQWQFGYYYSLQWLLIQRKNFTLFNTMYENQITTPKTVSIKSLELWTLQSKRVHNQKNSSTNTNIVEGQT